MSSAPTPTVSLPRARSFGLALADIKIAHSVFALPFALLGAFLAGPLPDRGKGRGAEFIAQLGLIVACMVFARTWAMLVNRLADRRFDAANPRTAGRPLASGRLPVRTAAGVAMAAGAAFVACCAGFYVAFGNAWPVALSVPTLMWIAFYSFTKRFTALSHLVLGAALALSPIAAAIAVDPGSLASTPAIWLLAGATMLWVAGFDTLYAMQDEEFDRRTGLRSLPAWLGTRRAAWVSRGLHAGAACCFVLAWRVEPRFGAVFLAGASLAIGCLIAEHAVLARRGLPGLPMAFGLLNGVVSVLVGTAGIVDINMP